MYEERKDEKSRSVRLWLFSDFPWVVRAFFNLLVVVFFFILLFGFAEKQFDNPIFGEVTSTLSGLVELIVGAIVGALATEAKSISQRLKKLDGNNSGVADDESS
jgi:uncharacterized membrane protein (DUF485 family)